MHEMTLAKCNVHQASNIVVEYNNKNYVQNNTTIILIYNQKNNNRKKFKNMC